MDEQWKPIPDYPGYEVSNTGQVQSYYVQRGMTWVIADSPQRILKGGMSWGNYRHVCLRNQQGAKSTHIHRLVAAAFIGPCPEGLEVCHFDGDPSNCHVENLRYDTHTENAQDMIRHGRGGRGGGGEQNRKLTDDQVLEIRALRAQEWSTKKLVQKYGVSKTLILDICAKKARVGVGGPRTTGQVAYKLNRTLARQIRQERAAGASIVALGIKYGVHKSTISLIANNKRWAD